jgi:hypothetical protein
MPSPTPFGLFFYAIIRDCDGGVQNRPKRVGLGIDFLLRILNKCVLLYFCSVYSDSFQIPSRVLLNSSLFRLLLKHRPCVGR